MPSGAVLHVGGSTEPAIEAFGLTLTGLGYSRTGGDLDVQIRTSERGTAVVVALKKEAALGLGRKLATMMRRRVRVLTVCVDHDPERLECVLDDRVMMPDGAATTGRWGEETTGLYGDNWGLVCDDKPHFALAALLEVALEEVSPAPCSVRHEHWSPPPSLGSARLDGLAEQRRFADRVDFTNIGGRACVRIATGGASVTAFLEAEELEVLRAALG